MRPANDTWLTPAWALKVSVPFVTARRHFGLRRLPCVRATHLPFTLRPIAGCEKVSVTLAAWSRLNVNVVPTGARRLSFASLLPSRQRACDWLTDVSVGATVAVLKV